MHVEAFTALSNGFEIHGRIHLPDHCPAPGVICSHGLFSSKDSVKFIAVAQHLAERGFVAIRYDHRGCGDSQGRIENTTLSNRLEDLQAVNAFVREQTQYVDGRMGLMGSSMGGLVSLWEAAKHRGYHAVVAWSTPMQIRTSPQKMRSAGLNALDDAFFADLKQYPLIDVLGVFKCCIIVHGSSDELVPVVQAYRLYQNLGEPKRLEILPGADHRFSHPEHRRQAIEQSAGFFHQYLM